MKVIKFTVTLLFFVLLPTIFDAQTVSVTGRVFEKNNPNFLNDVKITVYILPGKVIASVLNSDKAGEFKVTLPVGKQYLILAQKNIFENAEKRIDTRDKKDEELISFKLEMRRKPGYIFDATIAESTEDKNQPANEIQGARVEVYNNTTETPELVLKEHPFPNFSHRFEQGNHYTMMIRKEGFLAKRIEAYINIKGCIVCVNGVKKIGPGITQNLSYGFQSGTLSADIELNRADLNSKIAVSDIYYDLNQWDIRPDAAEQLDKVVRLMKDNPEINVELGSHTDSRGGDDFNLKLSEKRAKAAVDYIISAGKLDSTRIISKGYGESRLKNHCKNGVPCSEKNHQLNRRTELKIIGFNEKKGWKSLEQLIREELFEKKLKVLEDQENQGEDISSKKTIENDSVKSPASEKETESESEIEEFKTTGLESDNSRPDSLTVSLQNLQNKENEEVIIPDIIVEKILIPPPVERFPPTPSGNIEEPEAKIPPILPDSSPIKIDSPQEEFPPTDLTDILIPAPEKTKSDEIILEAKKELEKLIIEEFDEEKSLPDTMKVSESPGLGAGELILTDDLTLNQDTFQAIPSTGSDESPYSEIPKDYTGYKVEILRSPELHSKEHTLLSENEKVFVELLEDKEYAYLLGDFRVKRIALYFLNNNVIEKYPNAKLILYENGKRKY